jgi:[acyl-carrier-protein] S-malonyltransferase
LLDQRTTAFVFPGQGSQFVGMGAALSAHYRVARQTFEDADGLLGFPLSRLCFEGPEEVLNATVNAQPALYVAGIAAMRIVYDVLGEEFQPACVAGHSLGELTALTAAGALSFQEGLKLVRRRGEVMRDAGEHSPGGMAALLGVELAEAEALCADARAKTGGVLVVANDNCPGQVVIAGDEATLIAAMAAAKRAVRLPVSIASHSPLMNRAQAEFARALAETHFYEPVIPIIGNTQARPLQTADEVRSELHAQLTSPVRWTDSIRTMVDMGITIFIELGSKNVLTGLIKRIDRDVTSYVVDSPEGVAALEAL